jgi:transposase
MESTGIYWKSPYAALEAVGIRGQVVNARHVKNVPGRKTDVGDAQWLATLAPEFDTAEAQNRVTPRSGAGFRAIFLKTPRYMD